MEEWSNSSDDSPLHEVETVERENGCASDPELHIDECGFDASKERLRGLFDQVLMASMREKSRGGCFRPFPALLGDGRPVDLFKLFWVVRKIGGYNAVSRKNVWGFVVGECGLGYGSVPLVKLIYMKYLNELDQWLSDKALEDIHNGVLHKLDLLTRELERRQRGSLSYGQEKRESDRKIAELNCFNNVNVIDYDSTDKELHLPMFERTRERMDNMEYLYDEKLYLKTDNISQASAESLTRKISSEICNVSDGIISDDDKMFCTENDLAASAKRIVEKAVSQVYDISKGSTDDIKSCVGDNDSFTVLAKKVIDKVITKVHNHDEIVVNERSPVKENNTMLLDEKVERVIGEVQNSSDDSAQNDNNVLLSAASVIGTGLESRKRKQESHSFSRMLNWLIHVAGHSDDPGIGNIPECSQWNNNGPEQYWRQVLLVRKALLIRHVTPNGNGSLHQCCQDQQKKLRMDPSMYEDDAYGTKSGENLRFSRRVSSFIKPSLCPCCKSQAVPQIKVVSPPNAEVTDGPKETVAAKVDALAAGSKDCESGDMQPEKQVSVGPLFQAEVPEWTGVLAMSDPKWLGTQRWTPEDSKRKLVVDLNLSRKKAQHPCSCTFQNSVECIRFHIAEKRLKLKRELGSFFFHWGFHRMGEEVSLSWTKDEERRFKDGMRSSAAIPNKFWKNASRLLVFKTRNQLVSYYFNVFLFQRRSYQNRVTPNDIDSDDDEKECGVVGDTFGYQAIKIHRSNMLTCTQNKECTDFV